MRLRCLHVALLLALGAPSSAHAIVGASEPAPELDASTLMVLSRGAGAAGFCTGIVVNPRKIVTAAHCVASVATTRLYKSGQSELPTPAKITVHPLYRADAVRARKRSVDLAIIETATDLPTAFRPAGDIDAGPDELGQSMEIFGYGVAQEGIGASGGALRKGVNALRAPHSSLLVWLSGNSGACSGDSGGPILWNGQWIGIILFAEGQGGRQCGALTQGLRLAPFRKWIDEPKRGM